MANARSEKGPSSRGKTPCIFRVRLGNLMLETSARCRYQLVWIATSFSFLKSFNDNVFKNHPCQAFDVLGTKGTDLSPSCSCTGAWLVLQLSIFRTISFSAGYNTASFPLNVISQNCNCLVLGEREGWCGPPCVRVTIQNVKSLPLTWFHQFWQLLVCPCSYLPPRLDGETSHIQVNGRSLLF